jgi:hypothetical protein
VSAAVQAHLLAVGFEHVASKQQVSVHIKDIENFSSVNVSFLVDESEVTGHKTLQIRKVKTGSSKLYFLSGVSPAGSPDYRFKLLAQYDLPEDEPESSGPEVWRYARACLWTGSRHPFREELLRRYAHYSFFTTHLDRKVKRRRSSCSLRTCFAVRSESAAAQEVSLSRLLPKG